MKDFFLRLVYKSSGFKALFAVGIVVALCLHDFSGNNKEVLEVLIGSVLGAKAVQYVAGALVAMKGGKLPEDS